MLNGTGGGCEGKETRYRGGNLHPKVTEKYNDTPAKTTNHVGIGREVEDHSEEKCREIKPRRRGRRCRKLTHSS